MRNTARLLAALLSLIAGPALAQNLPANSVMGRLAIPTGGGPAQSIPLASLAAAMGPNFIGTALQAASFEAMTTGGFKLGGSTFANQISTLGVAVNWLYSPDGTNAFSFDNTSAIIFGNTIYNEAKNATVLSSLSSTVYQVNSSQMAVGASPLSGMLNVKGSNSDSTVFYGESQGTAGSLSAFPATIVLRDLSTSHSSLINTQAVNSAAVVKDRAFGLNGGFIIWDSAHEQTDLDILGYRNGAVETMLQVYSGCLSAFNNNGNGPICPVDQSPRIAPGNTNSIYDVGAPATRFKSIYGTNVDVATNLILNGATSGTITMKAAAIAGSNTITWPAGTTDFSATGGAGRVLKQTSAGAALTVAALTAAELPAPFTSGTASGNTAKFATVAAGVLTAGHAATFDASGNIQDGGAASGVLSLNSATGNISWTVVTQTFCPAGCTTTIAGGSTGTYTPTSGMKYARLECVAGGGGGGGAANSATGTSGGGGGQSGGYASDFASAATVGASKTVSIGVAGLAGAAAAGTGGTGGDSSVGTIIVAKGGVGGGGAPNISSGAAGSGAIAGTGTPASPGMPGIAGYGASVVSALYPAGNGGSNLYGAGGPASNGAGATGTGFGGGGSGGVSYSNSGSFAGGAGAPGFCKATEYIIN